MSLLIVRLPRP